jgi:protein O-mannosyl-transferase
MPSRKRNRTSCREPQPFTDGRSWNRVGLLAILLATIVVYSPAIHGGQLWDDDAHLTRPELQSTGGLYRIWFELGATQQYYPLLHSAFWLEHKLWGDWLPGYHMVNVMWHLIAVSLVYAILTRLKIAGALLAAAIFALHPVMVESVAWVSEQKNTLSAVFYLSAMFVYLEFDKSRRPVQYLAALGLFVLGLLTKTVIATLPAALLVIFWWQRGTLSLKRDLAPLLPFFQLGAAGGIVTAWVERKLIGAEGADFELSLLQRILLAGRAVWFYFGKLLWPADLVFIYPRWKIDPTAWWQWLFPSSLLAALAALWVLRKKYRGPLAGSLLFVGTLFPVLGMFNVYPFIFSFVADHFQYLASVAIFTLTAAGVAHAYRYLLPAVRKWCVAGCALALATCAYLTFQQSQMYANTITLYQTTIDRNPDCWMAYHNLGWELFTADKLQGAIEQYRRTIAIRPNYYRAQTNLGNALAKMGQMEEALEHLYKAIELQPNLADAHRNLGNALTKTNRLREAIGEFQTALVLRGEDPLTLNSLGGALTQAGRYTDAIEHLQHAVRVKPDYAEARSNLGNALAKSGRLDEAIEELRAAAALKHDDAGIASNLGAAYLQAGRVNEAIDELRRAVQLNPSAETHSNLGNALTKAGRLPEAIDELRSAVVLKPDYVLALHNMGIALMQGRRFAEAVKPLQEAVRLQPNSTDAHNDLGAALTETGRRREAIEQFRISTRLKPDHFRSHYNLGILLAASGDDTGAMLQLEQALKLRPDSVVAHNSIGELLRQTGRPQEAIEHYQTALRLEPKSVELYANLAQSLASANRREEAFATAKKGIAVANSLGQEAAAKQLEEWLSRQK